MSKPKTTVSIIGPAQDRHGVPKLDKDLFERMKAKARKLITETWKLEPGDVELVSGGAAWADHVAVQLFLGEERLSGAVTADAVVDKNPFGALRLHLPCNFDEKANQFFSDKKQKKDPAVLANTLHGYMSFKTGYRTGTQLSNAKRNGAVFVVHDGFHARNAHVAKSEYMIAFSWGKTEPPEGGTRHTWSLAACEKHKRAHVALSMLVASAAVGEKRKLDHFFAPSQAKKPKSAATPAAFATKASASSASGSGSGGAAAVPAGFGYSRDFITSEQEAALVKFVDAQTWKTAINTKRRVQEYGYTYHTGVKTFTPSATTPIPPELEEIGKLLVSRGIMTRPPEQIIVNEYEPGQGIGAHSDSLVFGGEITSLSLLSPVAMEFVSKADEKRTFEVQLQARSLLSLRGDARYEWTHEIRKRCSDKWQGKVVQRGRRISLTFRHMRKQEA